MAFYPKIKNPIKIQRGAGAATQTRLKVKDLYRQGSFMRLLLSKDF